MATPLLATKLYAPPSRSNWVPRQRLIERLSEGLQRQLTLISAPAGFGKTSLVTEWHTSPTGRGVPLAWLSLDDDDNDPARFLTYLIAALGTLPAEVGTSASLGADAQVLLQSHPHPPLKVVLTTLVNSLSNLPADFVLVLDDYQVIAAEQIHEAITYLLDHLPPRMHLVMTTRADPPLPLSRLRARGQLVELRAADLRFTLEEATVFLYQVMGLRLSTEDIAILEARTEGWIAGLQLVALSLQGREDVRSFIESFTGTNRYVLDYLTEEVLQHQTPDVRSFLLETCILDQLSGPLCDAVTHHSDSQALLGQLDRANLFLIPLDDVRKWYRYHRLFGDLLRGYLDNQQPDQMIELHRRASLWYEQNGFVSEAIGHALDAQDMERAAGLIEQAATAVLLRNEMTTVGNWLKVLPEGLLYSRSRLCVLSAWVMAFTGQIDAVEPMLQKAESLVSPDTQDMDSRDLLGQVRLIRAFRLVFEGDLPGARRLARESLQYLPEGDSLPRSFATWIFGSLFYLAQNLVAADQVLDTLKHDQAGNWVAILLSVYMRGYSQMLQGRLRQAAQTYRQGVRVAEADRRRLATGWATPLSPDWGALYQGLGEVLREQNQLDEAERYATQSVEVGEQWGITEITSDAYVTLARVKRARGDWNSAHAILGKAEQLVQEHRLKPFTAREVTAHLARLWLAQRDVASAARWAASVEGTHETGEDSDNLVAFLMREVERSTLARVFVAQGKFDQALHTLAPLLQAAESSGWRGTCIELLALQALALDGQGHADAALHSLQRALELAEPEGYVRIFVDEGDPMKLLISDFRVWIEKQFRLKREEKLERLLNYADKLLAAFSEPGLAPAEQSEIRNLQSAILVEPLSERELAVLRLIAEGDSNQEIAAKLVVAVSTVKTHIYNIYGKLGVGNRVQALARARELKLL